MKKTLNKKKRVIKKLDLRNLELKDVIGGAISANEGRSDADLKAAAADIAPVW
jgi:hypothetical protein